MPEAYCVKCRKKHEMEDAKPVEMNSKRGKRYAIEGRCPTHDIKMFKIISKEDYDKLTS